MYLNIVLLIFLALTGCTPFTDASHRGKADRYYKEGNFELAIHEYERHIQERLKISSRPEWENPYLYYLDIGDSYLGLERPEQALETYFEAENRGVEVRFINDRIRSLARWYEERGERLKAINLLKTYRERDSLLFDMMLDRISRELASEGYSPEEETEVNQNNESEISTGHPDRGHPLQNDSELQHEADGRKPQPELPRS